MPQEAALAGLELTLELGVEALRGYNLRQKALLASLLRRSGIEVSGDDEGHGAFLTLARPDAADLSRRLRERGVATDARGDALRLGPDLLNADEELERAAAALAALVLEK